MRIHVFFTHLGDAESKKKKTDNSINKHNFEVIWGDKNHVQRKSDLV